MGVIGAHDFAQHLFALDHAAQNIRMHVIGKARTGITRQNPRVGVAGAGASGNGVWDGQLRESDRIGHGVSSHSGQRKIVAQKFVMLRDKAARRKGNAPKSYQWASIWVGN